ncbi:MAG: AarF/UbiB family protein [Paludibacteraceae bacterium]
MEYPSITKYDEAVLYADSFDKLQHLVPEKDHSGKPLKASGNFAVVYKMRDKNTRRLYALKCFTQDQPERAVAYKMIADQLRYLDAPFFVKIEYYDEELWVENYDRALPVVLMEWVDGEPLDKYIRRVQNENEELLSLVSYKFSVMASWLVNQPFAHGDVKPDNILVRPDGSLVLVDYDGLFVPAMKGMKQRECGTPGFRHPARENAPFDECIDDFSLATINLSLYAIAMNPALLDSHVGADRLLFTEDDYKNLAHCRAMEQLGALCYDPQMQRLYGLFLIALAEGNLARCENRLMLVAPPTILYDLPTIGLPSNGLQPASAPTTEQTGTHNGHTWVDLGLPSGLKWATCNVGATTPEGYGNYYAWGETTPKDYYDWSTYKYGSDYDELTKYCTDSDYGKDGFADYKTVLDPEDDAARANWGGSWRMPTDAEWQELIDKCTWTWTTLNGKNGYEVKGTNGNSIFLPAAGYRNDDDLGSAGNRGDYWSGSLDAGYPGYAWFVRFSSGYVGRGSGDRCYGHSVRPVL